MNVLEEEFDHTVVEVSLLLQTIAGSLLDAFDAHHLRFLSRARGRHQWQDSELVLGSPANECKHAIARGAVLAC